MDIWVGINEPEKVWLRLLDNRRHAKLLEEFQTRPTKRRQIGLVLHETALDKMEKTAVVFAFDLRWVDQGRGVRPSVLSTDGSIWLLGLFELDKLLLPQFVLLPTRLVSTQIAQIR
jgi:hypothetical protein